MAVPVVLQAVLVSQQETTLHQDLRAPDGELSGGEMGSNGAEPPQNAQSV